MCRRDAGPSARTLVAGRFSAAAWPHSTADNGLLDFRFLFLRQRGPTHGSCNFCVSESQGPRIRTVENRDRGLAAIDELNAPLTRAQWIFENACRLGYGNF